MMQRSIWGLLYALVIAFVCTAFPWSPGLLFFLLLGVALEALRLPGLSPKLRAATLLYTFAQRTGNRLALGHGRRGFPARRFCLDLAL
jgi:hypothetical protein